MTGKSAGTSLAGHHTPGQPWRSTMPSRGGSPYPVRQVHGYPDAIRTAPTSNGAALRCTTAILPRWYGRRALSSGSNDDHTGRGGSRAGTGEGRHIRRSTRRSRSGRSRQHRVSYRPRRRVRSKASLPVNGSETITKPESSALRCSRHRSGPHAGAVRIEGRDAKLMSRKGDAPLRRAVSAASRPTKSVLRQSTNRSRPASSSP